MTLSTTDKATQVANLLALDDDDFTTLVNNNLGQDSPVLLWQHLTSPDIVRRTYTTLTTHYNDVCGQLAERAAHMKAFQTDCFERPDGRQAWSVANRDYQRWRGKALFFKRLLMHRIAETKRALPAAPLPPSAARLRRKKVRHTQTIFRLAWAIREHQQACEDADIRAEPHDEDLWDALEEIEVDTEDGIITVAEMLDNLSSKPDFIPPSKKEETPDEH